MRPNLLVAGTQKAGTTWLHTQLARHPDVFMSSTKELNFFSNGRASCDTNLFREYLRNFDAAEGHRWVGESTPHYLWRRDPKSPFSPPPLLHDVAEFARQTLGPDLTAIVSLRDPVSRAVSAYWHNFAMGRIDLNQSIFRCPPEMGIVDLGFYERHLRHWQGVLERDHLHVLIFDDLLTSPRGYLQQALSVLDLEANAQFWNGYQESAIGARERVSQLRTTDSPISEQEVAALLTLFEPDIRHVEALLERELADWRDLERLVALNCRR